MTWANPSMKLPCHPLGMRQQILRLAVCINLCVISLRGCWVAPKRDLQLDLSKSRSTAALYRGPWKAWPTKSDNPTDEDVDFSIKGDAGLSMSVLLPDMPAIRFSRIGGVYVASEHRNIVEIIIQSESFNAVDVVAEVQRIHKDTNGKDAGDFSRWLELERRGMQRSCSTVIRGALRSEEPLVGAEIRHCSEDDDKEWYVNWHVTWTDHGLPEKHHEN
jgi:hypothetical protein